LHPASAAELSSSTIAEQQQQQQSDAEMFTGDSSSPASNTHSKATKLPMHYYDERDADKDFEEKYSARSVDGSNDNDGENSEAGAGR
jgi:hypothetical protein